LKVPAQAKKRSADWDGPKKGFTYPATVLKNKFTKNIKNRQTKNAKKMAAPFISQPQNLSDSSNDPLERNILFLPAHEAL
jgi:hypothetical protein